MVRRSVSASIALYAPLLLLTCFPMGAQTTETKFYRLDFTVKEVEDGRAINSRTYSSDLALGEHRRFPSIRTGSKVPVQNEGNGFTYIDVGISLDCTQATLAGNDLSLDLSAEVSSFVPVTDSPDSRVGRNVIRQNRWSSSVLVPLRKATVVFSSDDLTSKRKLQVEVTATPIVH